MQTKKKNRTWDGHAGELEGEDVAFADADYLASTLDVFEYLRNRKSELSELGGIDLSGEWHEPVSEYTKTHDIVASSSAELGGPGSGFKGHKGRDAENLRGGSVKRDIVPSELMEYRINSIAQKLNVDRSHYYFEYEQLPDFKGTLAETDERSGFVTFYMKPISKTGDMDIMGNTLEGIAAHEFAHSKSLGGGSGALWRPFENNNPTPIKDWKPFTKYLAVHYKYSGKRDGDWWTVAAEGYAELARLDVQGQLNEVKDTRWLKYYDDVNVAIESRTQRKIQKDSYNKTFWGRMFPDKARNFSDELNDMDEFGGKGSGFHGHKGRDAENLRGGSVARGTSAKADIAPPKQTNAKEIKQIAQSLGHDPKKVNVYMAEGKDFVVNGKHFTTAGTYSPETDEIEIFGLYNMTTNEAKGIVAHEVMHGKFERFNDLAKAQMDEIRAIPDWDKVVIRGDGSLRDGYEKYWAYDLQYNYLNKSETMEHLQKTDGITDYSRAWWSQANQYTDTKYRAIDETLSEIARTEVWGTLSSDEIDPKWFDLYNKVKYGKYNE